MLTQQALAKLQVKDTDLARIQNNVENAINPILQTPTLNGNLLTGLVIPTNLTLTIPTKLGRAPNGWHIVSASGAYAPPYALPNLQTNPTGALVLTFPSGAGVTIGIWVF